jgi:hypothetical protein
MMRGFVSLRYVLAMAALSCYAQESHLQSDFRREADAFRTNCTSFNLESMASCGQVLFTGAPLHIAVGSLAPQNGIGFGPAFVLHSTPNEQWRLSWNVDAVGTMNGSWRAGVYMKAIRTPVVTITPVISGAGTPAPSNLTVRDSTVFNLYTQAISLNTVDYFGLGPSTTRSARAIFGVRQTVVGGNVIFPIVPKLKLSLFGEVNGRFVAVRGNPGQSSPSIEQLYSPATAPGLVSQPGFVQFGEGVRMRPALLSNHLQLNYEVTFQEFLAPGDSTYSFNRFTTDLTHDFPLYRNQTARRVKDFNGPDECSSHVHTDSCPAVSRNREGTISLRFLLSESFTSAGHVVPFYFQPTLGGSDINGNQLLPSYQDYRFRAPNLMLFRASFEHSIWGPLGFLFLVDEGKVALTHSDLDFSHLSHSFATGLTLRAGGFPQVSLLFAWGGKEGTHTIAWMNSSLLGSAGRPAFY